MRAFLEPLGAALYDASDTRAPKNTVWTKQVISSLRWLNLFFTDKSNHIERFFKLDAYLRVGATVEMGTDASP